MFKYLKQKNKSDNGFTRLVDFNDASIKIRAQQTSSLKLTTGFTLVETLVAISVFSLSIVGLMSVLANGISDMNYAKNKMVASYLAQEGIEYVRNVRDTYVLYGTDGSEWSDFLNELTPCKDSLVNGCHINYSFEKLDISFLATNDVFQQCFLSGTNGDPCFLYYHDSTGKYDHQALGSYSGFRRVITYSIDAGKNGDEIIVNSSVTWSKASKTYTVQTSASLLKWKEK